MCGIWAIFGFEAEDFTCVAKYFNKISHRGPDALRLEANSRLKNGYLGFHRLAILDGTRGMQPMRLWQYPHLFLLCNGEIYNFEKLAEQFGSKYSTRCDVEIIIHLYHQGGAENVAKSLDGEFAFCLVDTEKNRILIGRDPYGVRPLFRMQSSTGQLAISSESKALMGLTSEMLGAWNLEQFHPGCYEEYEILPDGKVKLLETTLYHQPGDKPSFETFVPWNKLKPANVSENIRNLLSAAVEKRLMADRRIGCLLSGGLDSSLIAALLVKLAKEKNFDYTIQSFAVGMKGSPDLEAAKQVALHLGTDHHEVIFTQIEINNVLDKVIYSLETFDVTTIRASIGMYILAQYIKEKTETTVIFSGEGADEVAQGYIYFRDAPSAGEAHKESLRLLKDIHLYDGLRADRTMSAHSLELRVPFLDIQFTNYYLSLDAAARQPQNKVEKYLLRSAFEGTELLPKNILWRHKEAFSDGVVPLNSSIFSHINEVIDRKMEDEDSAEKYTHCVPKTKEALYYRKIFESHYSGFSEKFTPYLWMPRWNSEVKDPSARFIDHYAAGKTDI